MSTGRMNRIRETTQGAGVTIEDARFASGPWIDVTSADYGAVGDNSTDDTDAVQEAFAAASSGSVVFFPPGLTFKLLDQLNVPEGVEVRAHGAILRWTKFGSSIPASGTPQGLTGNGVRLNSRSKWLGGHLKMDGVPTPSNVSVDTAVMGGNFWCLLMIGHFNTATISSVNFTTFTEDVTVADVTLELVSGFGNALMEVMGASRRIKATNIVLKHSSSDVADKVLMEATWGAQDGGETWHPYDLKFTNWTLTGSNDTDDETRGIHVSGCYDVKFTKLSATGLRFPFSWAIGDPGDPRVTKDAGSAGKPNSAQAGKICTGLELDGYDADSFDIALRVVGDANGSSHEERRTHSMRCLNRGFNLRGQGATAVLGVVWSSNFGIMIDDASDVECRSGVITECFEGISIQTPSAPATSVTEITRSSQTATATTSVAHELDVGDQVVVSGADQAEYNGVFIVNTTPTTTSFAYTVAGSPTTPATGTIVCGRFAPPDRLVLSDLEIYNISRNGIGGSDVNRPTIKNCRIYHCDLNSALATAAHIRLSPRGGVIEGNFLGAGLAESTPYAIYDTAASYLRGPHTLVRNNIILGAATAGFQNGGDLMLDRSNRLADGVPVSTVAQVDVSLDKGDADATLTPGTDPEIQRWATTLTGNRTVTLATGFQGARFRVVRTGLGAFTLDVGGLKTIPSGTAAFVDVAHDGSAWVLTGYGAL